MIYEPDPELPFQKILVKKDSAIVGVIRRNLLTGHYQYHDGEGGALHFLFKELRIDKIKRRIEELSRDFTAVQ